VTAPTLTRRLPRLSTADTEHVLAQRPDATDVRPYVAWLAQGRRVRHGEHGIPLPAAKDGRPRARVFDIDQTDEDPDAAATLTRPAPTTQPAPYRPAGDGPMTLATCSYSEFQPAMGVPVRFTVGYPFRLRLAYKPAGHAKLITPTRDMLSLPEDAYTFRYLQILNSAGVNAIRGELAAIAGPGGRVVLLCFERLNEPAKKPGGHNWCHRSLFAQWWTQQTGEDVPELGKLPACGQPYVPAAAGFGHRPTDTPDTTALF
jgi:hypothetical protein